MVSKDKFCQIFRSEAVRAGHVKRIDVESHTNVPSKVLCFPAMECTIHVVVLSDELLLTLKCGTWVALCRNLDLGLKGHMYVTLFTGARELSDDTNVMSRYIKQCAK